MRQSVESSFFNKMPNVLPPDVGFTQKDSAKDPGEDGWTETLRLLYSYALAIVKWNEK